MTYNIPQTLLDRVKRAMRMEDEDFKAYLSTLETEATAYSKSLLYTSFDDLDKEVKNILITFYMQYALYAKIEKDEISQDKLEFLNSYIAGHNDKFEKNKLDTANSKKVVFI